MKKLILAGSAIALLLLPTNASSAKPTSTQKECSEKNMPVQTAPDGTKFVRTPDACFKNLPDWTYQEKSILIGGLRQGYVDKGPRNGQIVLMLHGQPSWSYLYRYMIRDLSKMGYRVIAMDNLGFGYSDKPIDLKRYSFKDHAYRLVAFMDALKLKKVTLFAQDWGSVIGLYVAGGDLSRFDRMIIGNGGLPVIKNQTPFAKDIAESNAAFGATLKMVPPQQPSFYDENGNSILPTPEEGSDIDVFSQWMTYAMYEESFRPSIMLEALTYKPLTDAQRAAYDAPYPSRLAMAGPRTFPSLRNELMGITVSRLEALKNYKKPFLSIIGENEPGMKGTADGSIWLLANIPGAKGQQHHRYPDASHFLQDDKGPDIAKRIDAFIKSNP